MIKIKDWTLLYTSRNKRPYLVGFVYGHPGHEDGTDIRTSPIAVIEGRIITTSSGNVYELETSLANPLAGVIPKPILRN